jgi:hypothetical protein
MNYKAELRIKIKKAGRTRNWISTQMDMSRVTFWRKVNSDTLTKDEKSKLNNLLK